MPKYRDLNRGEAMPASWTDAIQEFIGTGLINFRLERATATSLKVPAGANNDQVAAAIQGRWRYVSADVTATAPGGLAVGEHPIFLTASDNSFAETPVPDTDNTVYTFGLEIRATGVPTTALYREIGRIFWDGAAISDFRLYSQTVVIRSGPNANRPNAADSNVGQFWFSTDTNGGTLFRSSGTAWVQIAMSTTLPDAVAGNGLGIAAGVLAVNVDASTLEISGDSLRVKALGITDAHIAAANKDGTAAVPSLRTLGTSATQAAAGNDSRLPAGADIVDADISGSAAIAESKLALASDAAAGTASRRTLGVSATSAAAGNDSRLSDARVPTAHAATHADGGTDEVTTALDPRAYPMLSGTLAARPAFGVAGRFYWTSDEGILYRDSGTAWVKVAVRDYPDLDGIPATFAPSAHATAHQPGGADAMAIDAAAAIGSLRTLGTGATQAAAGNDSRLPVGADIVDADVGASAAIAESKLALASDAAAGTASRRTLGAGATQAAAGNDSRLSDQRVPTDGSVTDAKLGKRAAARCSRASGTAVTNTGLTTVDMDTEDLDNDNLYTVGNDYIQLNRAGIWLCEAMLQFGSDADGRRLARIVQYNSVNTFQGVVAEAGAAPNPVGDVTRLAMSGWWNFAVNDRVYLEGYDVNQGISWGGSWLSVVYLGTY